MIPYDQQGAAAAQAQWEAGGGTITALAEGWYAARIDLLAMVNSQYGLQVEIHAAIKLPDNTTTARKLWMNLQGRAGPNGATQRILHAIGMATGATGPGGLDEQAVRGKAVDLYLSPKKNGKGNRLDDVAPRGTKVAPPAPAYVPPGAPPAGQQQGEPPTWSGPPPAATGYQAPQGAVPPMAPVRDGDGYASTQAEVDAIAAEGEAQTFYGEQAPVTDF